MSFEFDEDYELDAMFEGATEFDPEYQRERMREQLEIAAWDIREGHVEDGETWTIEEPSVLTPDPLDDTDFEWTLRFDDIDVLGDESVPGVFEVMDPEGEYAGQFGAYEDGEELLNALGHIAQTFHRDREIAKFHARVDEMEPGDSHLLPSGKIELRDAEKAAIFGPGYEERVVTNADKVTPKLVKRVEGDWRAEMREKYRGTPMEEEF